MSPNVAVAIGWRSAGKDGEKVMMIFEKPFPGPIEASVKTAAGSGGKGLVIMGLGEWQRRVATPLLW